MSPPNTYTKSMGLLGRLPPELRLMVWNDYLDSVYPSHGSTDAPRKGLGLLLTCRQIYEEASHCIYERGSFTFRIFPLIPTFNTGASSSSAARSRRFRKWSFQVPDDDPVVPAFQSIPWERTGEIKIEIRAPRQDDPGQIITLWKKVKLLVDMLSTAKSLKNLEIHFIDSRKGRWSKDGNPQQSIEANPSIETGSAELPTDFRALLLLFTDLRNVKYVCFQAPEAESVPKSLVNRCMQAMITEDLSWSGLVNSALPEDQEFQDEIDTTFMQFDRALDTLGGGTAFWLRLERFSSWYVKIPESNELQESGYVKEVQRISTSGRIPASKHGNTS